MTARAFHDRHRDAGRRHGKAGQGGLLPAKNRPSVSREEYREILQKVYDSLAAA